ncbi:MAG: SHOCT domain-containing protein [Halanaeroarchaeum sp.]
MADDLLKILIGILAAVLLFPLLMMALFVPFAGAMGMGGYSVGYGMTGVGWLFMLVPLILLALFGWLVYRLLTGQTGVDRALEELREAYARGELTTEEFEERMERLNRE